MFKEYRYAGGGGRFSVDLDKVVRVACGNGNHAILFLDGGSDGIEIDMDYDTFMEMEMGAGE